MFRVEVLIIAAIDCGRGQVSCPSMMPSSHLRITGSPGRHRDVLALAPHCRANSIMGNHIVSPLLPLMPRVPGPSRVSVSTRNHCVCFLASLMSTHRISSQASSTLSVGMSGGIELCSSHATWITSPPSRAGSRSPLVSFETNRSKRNPENTALTAAPIQITRYTQHEMMKPHLVVKDQD